MTEPLECAHRQPLLERSGGENPTRELGKRENRFNEVRGSELSLASFYTVGGAVSSAPRELLLDLFLSHSLRLTF